MLRVEDPQRNRRVRPANPIATIKTVARSGRSSARTRLRNATGGRHRTSKRPIEREGALPLWAWLLSSLFLLSRTIRRPLVIHPGCRRGTSDRGAATSLHCSIPQFREEAYYKFHQIAGRFGKRALPKN